MRWTITALVESVDVATKRGWRLGGLRARIFFWRCRELAVQRGSEIVEAADVMAAEQACDNDREQAAGTDRLGADGKWH